MELPRPNVAKSPRANLFQKLWDLLGEYESWLTTSAQLGDPNQLAPFDAKPLLILTEDAPIQEQVFFREIPKDARLRLFGSAQTAKSRLRIRPSGGIWRQPFRPRSS